MASKHQIEKSSEEENKDVSFIEGFQNINAYAQGATRSLLGAVRSSHSIPSKGDDFDYYSSFESFRQYMDMEGQKVCEMIQRILKYHGIKGNLSSTSQALDIEEKFDVLVDANDQLLERAGTFMDEAAGVRKTEAPLIVASATPKTPLSGSWKAKAHDESRKQQKSPKGQIIRLLTAKNIARPQLNFADKVDNTNKPFLPKIKEKPNAMKPLLESLGMDIEPNEDDVHFEYPHPYQFELDNFVPDQYLLQQVEPTMPAALDDSPNAIFVDDVLKLHNMLEQLKTQREIAVDLEHHSYRSYQGFTCLVQISTRQQDYLVDALTLRSELHVLNQVFTDPKIVKVLHGADMDILWLQRDLGVYIVNMFDTSQASRVLNLSRHSLSYLLAQYCNIEADKQYQLADWRIRPLPDPFIRYAREDTHYLLYIYDLLKNQLLQRGNNQKNLLNSVLDRSKQICAQKYKKPNVDEAGYKRLYIKTRKVFNNQQLYALKNIFAWRDKIARQEDESTGYILPNHMLLQIAELLPKESQGVVACCNPVPPIVRQNLIEIHGMVLDARQQPLDTFKSPESMNQPNKPQMIVQKHNALSILNCPHDLKPQTAGKAGKLPPSCLFNGKDKGQVVTERTSPIVSVFATKQKTATAAEKKAQAIIKSMDNPFSKFLPNSQPVDLPSTLNSEPQPKWKLLPPTAKPKPKEKKVTPILAQPKTDDITINTAMNEKEQESGQITLRKELPKVPKKRKQNQDKVKQEKVPKTEDDEIGDNVAEVLSRLRKVHEEVVGEDGPQMDYSKEAMNMFSKGFQKMNTKGKKKEKKRKDFDPNAEGYSDEIKGANKQRANKAGNQSMTYTASSTKTYPKMNWPKK